MNSNPSSADTLLRFWQPRFWPVWVGYGLLRLLVLWVAVAGAVAASRNDKHINIAVLDRFLPQRFALGVRIFVHGFTAAICGIIAWYSLQFVLTSHEFGDVLLGGVPAWLLQLVLPVGFALIAYRYGLFTLQALVAAGPDRPS